VSLSRVASHRANIEQSQVPPTGSRLCMSATDPPRSVLGAPAPASTTAWLGSDRLNSQRRDGSNRLRTPCSSRPGSRTVRRPLSASVFVGCVDPLHV
jgi:hypothetical protein